MLHQTHLSNFDNISQFETVARQLSRNGFFLLNNGLGVAAKERLPLFDEIVFACQWFIKECTNLDDKQIIQSYLNKIQIESEEKSQQILANLKNIL